MMKAPAPIRALSFDDLSSVVRIDALYTGRRKLTYWRRVLGEFLDRAHAKSRVGLAAVDAGRVLGYLLGEVRAFEFGSEPCGWVFAVGVDPGALHRGVGTALVDAACRRFARQGVTTVRTMVRRNDVPLLAFFRSNGFAGGSFVELERDVDDDA
jgi:ribosomal protein S18 acetylase RimI-like enzyme